MSDPIVTVVSQPTVVRVASTGATTSLMSSSAPVIAVHVEQSVTALRVTPTPVTLLTAELMAPPGAPSTPTRYLGKTLVWAQGVLSEVLLYLDAAKTQLAERRILNRTGQTLTSIVFRDGDDTITKTRTLGYTSGVLTSVTEA